MHTKLDPQLADLVERTESSRGDAAAMVDVLVGLATPLDAAIRADLVARGLRMRSEIGTVLTGSVPLRDVRRLAQSPHVLKLEASTPLYREPTNHGE